MTSTCVRQCSQRGADVRLMSPQEVTQMLRANEYSHEMNDKESVGWYDSNQLASNNPIEDRRAEARCTLSKGLLFGVFDGHGGPQCAEVVSKRLLSYISASLLPHFVLEKYLASLEKNPAAQLLEHYNESDSANDDLKAVHTDSFKRHILQLMSRKAPFTRIEDALKFSFLKLDNDLSRESLEESEPRLQAKALEVGLSGAVCCVARINGPDLHLATVGDCAAVLGVCSGRNTWAAKMLTVQHTAENQEEVMRILKEHPKAENETVIKAGRLLGRLQPLRAFGDFKAPLTNVLKDVGRFKWRKEVLGKLSKKYGVRALVGVKTPPYLTARPHVAHHRLGPNDKFLVIATDGLWDMATPNEVVRLIGDHLNGRVFLSMYSLPHKNEKLRHIESKTTKNSTEDVTRTLMPADVNSATHLIRTILGTVGGEGFTPTNVSVMLSLPQDIVRRFRDDITITVVFFNTTYLNQT